MENLISIFSVTIQNGFHLIDSYPSTIIDCEIPNGRRSIAYTIDLWNDHWCEFMVVSLIQSADRKKIETQKFYWRFDAFLFFHCIDFLLLSFIYATQNRSKSLRALIVLVFIFHRKKTTKIEIIILLHLQSDLCDESSISFLRVHTCIATSVRMKSEMKWKI